jgi:glycosyltransferase involved in cell wall biosynthesis
LADAGHEVHLLSMNTQKHHIDLIDIPESIRKRIAIHLVDIHEEINAADALKNLLFSDLPYSAERFKSELFDEKLKELLSENDFDIVQLEGLYLALYISSIREHSTAKIAYRAHNIEHEIWERSLRHEKNLVKKRYLKILGNRLKRFELEVLNQYDLLLPITAKDAEYLDEAGNLKPLCVVPTGFDFKSIPKQESHNTAQESVFHLGALDWFPNQEGLIWFFDTVWNIVLKEFPNLTFRVAGRNAPDWFKGKLERYTNVVFDGEVSDAHEYMKDKQILVVPLLSGSGMRIKIVEGMALGKSIVTTPIGSEGIETNHKETIMEGVSPQEFADSLLFLLENPQKCSAIGENARSFIEKELNNKYIIENLVAFYENNI